MVTDASGAAVPGATVTIRNTATNESRTATTNDSGFYAFPSIIPGTYDVTITHAGFKKAEVTGRVAQVSESAQVDVTLEVGQTNESVTVRPRARSCCRLTTPKSVASFKAVW